MVELGFSEYVKISSIMEIDIWNNSPCDPSDPVYCYGYQHRFGYSCRPSYLDSTMIKPWTELKPDNVSPCLNEASKKQTIQFNCPWKEKRSIKCQVLLMLEYQFWPKQQYFSQVTDGGI